MLKVIDEGPALDIDVVKLKQYLRIEHSDDDAEIELNLAAVTEYLQKQTNRRLTRQTLELSLPGGHVFEIPYPPVHQINKIEYLDQDGDLQILLDSSYRLVGAGNHTCMPLIMPRPGSYFPSFLYEPDAVRITFEAGYETPPASLTKLVYLLVSDAYEKREASFFADMTLSNEHQALLNTIEFLPRIGC
jgi:uncharacterized phiE125 gp8 family phage protein